MTYTYQFDPLAPVYTRLFAKNNALNANQAAVVRFPWTLTGGATMKSLVQLSWTAASSLAVVTDAILPGTLEYQLVQFNAFDGTVGVIGATAIRTATLTSSVVPEPVRPCYL